MLRCCTPSRAGAPRRRTRRANGYPTNDPLIEPTSYPAPGEDRGASCLASNAAIRRLGALRRHDSSSSSKTGSVRAAGTLIRTPASRLPHQQLLERRRSLGDRRPGLVLVDEHVQVAAVGRNGGKDLAPHTEGRLVEVWLLPCLGERKREPPGLLELHGRSILVNTSVLPSRSWVAGSRASDGDHCRVNECSLGSGNNMRTCLDCHR